MEDSPGDVSKGTKSGGDKVGKSQLERKKKAEEPSLPGSRACQWSGEQGLWIPPLCSLKYIPWE